MADAKKSDKKPEEKPSTLTGDPFVDIVWAILTILVVVYIVNGFLNMLTSGRIFPKWQGGAVKTISLSSAPSLLGDEVKTNGNTKVYNLPGEVQIAEVPLGTEGELIDGPVFGDDGDLYWKVRFDNGVVGWVKEKDLDHIKGGKALSDMPSILGHSVESAGSASVYDYPGGNEIKKVDKGLRGKIIEGPMTVQGIKYWHIQFEDGTKGWVRESDLMYVQSDTTLAGLIKTWFMKFFNYFKFISVIISSLLILFINYLYKKLKYLGEVEEAKYYPKEVLEKSNINQSWERVLKHAGSENESDWRLAILEADIMLDDLLDKMSLPGDTIGDKLKSVEKSDFTTIDSAWEAHKIRNRIAHDGVSFQLNSHETRRVIDLYKQVFEEFRII